MENKILMWSVIVLLGFVLYLMIRLSSHECPEIVKTKIEIDTVYQEIEKQVMKTIPINTTIVKRETINDTTYVVKYKENQSTFTSVDTLRFDSLGVAVLDSGNCSGVLNRTATLFGKRQVIERTITNTISTPVPVFSLYGGVNNQIKNGSIKEVTPNALLMYEGKVGIEYGFGVMDKTHNVGVKFKISKK